MIVAFSAACASPISLGEEVWSPGKAVCTPAHIAPKQAMLTPNMMVRERDGPIGI
jgi:hypothetical protein